MQDRSAHIRLGLARAGAVTIVGVLLPPVGSYARQYALAEAAQYAVFAAAGPALLVLGAPWRILHPAGWSGRSRSRRTGLRRVGGWLVAFIMLAVGWRMPVAVTALARHQGLAVLEMLTLVAAGTGLWLQLVESPPLLPGISRPQRAAVAALAMWTIWIMAYLMGLSSTAWSAAFRHPGGR